MPVNDHPARARSFQIRPAAPEDAAALAAVEIAGWRAAYAGLMPDDWLAGLSHVEKEAGWRRSLLKHGALGRKRVLVAAGAAGVLGFVRVGDDASEPDVGLVYLLYVLPTEWGRGVGAALMAAALDELRALGYGEARLWVLRDNQRARAFYERLGWQPEGRTLTERYGNVDLEAWCYRRAVPATEQGE